MFARLTILQVETARINEFIKSYERLVITVARCQEGYKRDLMLTDQKTGKIIAITFWESKQDATATEISGHYQQEVGRFTDYFTNPPVREGYEVSIQR